MTGQERLTMWALGVLTTVVSLVASWSVSLWTDEAATISASQRSFVNLRQMLDTIDVVHGIYYASMHVWTALLGTSPVMVRLPSALAVGIAAMGVFVLAHRLAAERSTTSVAVTSVIVFLVLPRTTWLGIEARPYAFTAALAVWATVVLLRAREDGRPWWWGAYAVLVVLLVAVNIYDVLLLPAHAVGLLLDRRWSWRQRLFWAAAAILGVLMASPIVLKALTQTGQLGDEEFTWRNLVPNVGVNQWFHGGTPTTTTGESTTRLTLSDPATWWVPASLLLAGVCWILIIRTLFAAFRGRDGSALRASIWLVPWIALPTTVIGLYSIYVSPMYSSRYLSFATPAVALLIAVGIHRITARRGRLIAVGLVVALCLPVYLSQRQPYSKSGSDWVSAAAFVGAHARPGDGVYFAPRYPVTVAGLVGQTTRNIRTSYPADFSGLIDLTLAQTPADAANLSGWSRPLTESRTELARVDSVWVLRRVDDPADSAPVDEAFLRSEGLTADLSWKGPLDTVTRFTRH